MITVTLPWPDRKLSPNARTHWAAKAKVVKRARHTAKYLCLNAMGACGFIGVYARNDYKPRVEFTFHPADKRSRDLDNCIASMKGATDGIADAMNVNDSTFSLGYAMGEPRKPACVVVVIV